MRFGAYDFEPYSGELRKEGMRVRLEGQPVAILRMLLERPGELVTREELQKQLWPADTFVDFEHSLNAAIKRLRAALSDSADHPRYVETLARRGYRFIAPVNGAAVGDKKLLLNATPFAGRKPVGFRGRRLWLTVSLVLFAAGFAGLGWRQWWNRTAARPPVIKSLAVLPLENVSGDPAQEYFADGMTDELITDLAQIGSLRVISRTSAMQYKGAHKSLPEIARELAVDGIVEGTVFRSGRRVRITSQLIYAPSDQHLWAHSYERDLPDVLTLQNEIAQAVAHEVGATIIGKQVSVRAVSPEVSVRAASPEAYESYLKGRYYFNQRTGNALNKSIEEFQEAIAREPNYALAYSGLADAYAMLGFRGHFPSEDALSLAKAAASKAIALDETLAEPHASLAFIAETHEWDWATAEREYKRALELNPGDARAHHWYAGYLMYVGRFDEGIAEAERARDLDPLSLPVNNALAGRLLTAGRVDEALRQLQKTLGMNPKFAPAHQTLGWILLNKGKHQEAIREFQQAVQLAGPDDMDLTLDLGYAYATVGNQNEARRTLAKMKKLHERGLVPSAPVGILYGALGDLNDAFAWLDKAYKERDPELTYLKVGRRFEPLRNDPRFQKLLLRMGLAG